MPIETLIGGTFFIQGPVEQDWPARGEPQKITFGGTPDCYLRYETPVLTIETRVNKWQLWRVLGLQEFVRDRCLNKRVGFLILHGKKERTRKKNLARLIRILEKESRR